METPSILCVPGALPAELTAHYIHELGCHALPRKLANKNPAIIIGGVSDFRSAKNQ
jgi:hypothetical protein